MTVKKEKPAKTKENLTKEIIRLLKELRNLHEGPYLSQKQIEDLMDKLRQRKTPKQKEAKVTRK